MAFNCGVSFGACLVRITRVDSNGNVIAGSNSYVSDKPISIQVNPNNEAGNNFSVRNGCGCKVASRKNPDTFNFWELTFDTAAMEPSMQAFLLGAETIEVARQSGSSCLRPGAAQQHQFEHLSRVRERTRRAAQPAQRVFQKRQ